MLRLKLRNLKPRAQNKHIIININLLFGLYDWSLFEGFPNKLSFIACNFSLFPINFVGIEQIPKNNSLFPIFYFLYLGDFGLWDYLEVVFDEVHLSLVHANNTTEVILHSWRKVPLEQCITPYWNESYFLQAIPWLRTFLYLICAAISLLLSKKRNV